MLLLQHTILYFLLVDKLAYFTIYNVLTCTAYTFERNVFTFNVYAVLVKTLLIVCICKFRVPDFCVRPIGDGWEQ